MGTPRTAEPLALPRALSPARQSNGQGESRGGIPFFFPRLLCLFFAIFWGRGRGAVGEHEGEGGRRVGSLSRALSLRVCLAGHGQGEAGWAQLTGRAGCMRSLSRAGEAEGRCAGRFRFVPGWGWAWLKQRSLMHPPFQLSATHYYLLLLTHHTTAHDYHDAPTHTHAHAR